MGKKYSEKTAQALEDVVERIIYCRDNGLILDKKTLLWIQEAVPEIRNKLSAVGLIEKPQSYTTGELWDSYLRTKTDIKDSTRETYERARSRFFAFFKEHQMVVELTSPQMQQWKEFMITDIRQGRSEVLGLEESTVAGTLTKAKAVFNWAVRNGWLLKSPLDGIGRGSFINRQKDRFITMEEYHRLLAACPCADWRVILALARIGGLRAPSEVLRLKWSDINWERERFYVSSAKTERHQGKEGRFVPLFPALRKELKELSFNLSGTQASVEYVINRYRDPGTNLGTQFARIVQIANLEKIPRPFDNMRASRSTEIYAEFGPFLESKWIGHSTKIAKDHYLQVREVDFERAVGKPINFSSEPSNCKSVSHDFSGSQTKSPKKVAKGPNSLHDFSEALQNSLQQYTAMNSNASQPRNDEGPQTL